MPTTGPVPADGDPPDDPSAGTLAPAQDSRSDDADEARTEHPLPESVPPGGAAGAGA
jgi:hypothetical protein